jgi:uncharacterized protein
VNNVGDSTAWPIGAAPEICTGRVMHKRLKPALHQFSYGVFFLRVPLSALAQLSNRWFSLNRFNVLSFHVRDHGPRNGMPLDAWARALLAREGILSCDGEIVLQAFPRLFGYAFNPISIWYCYDRQGTLRAVLAEVRNTFGEHHNYLVAHDDERAIEAGDWLIAKKVFHVSPFCEVKGHYRFRFEQHGGRAFAQIDYFDGMSDTDKLLVTTIHGVPTLLGASSAIGAVLRHPLMTFGVVARIHWQALKLWIKRVPFFSKPEPPAVETTR